MLLYPVRRDYSSSLQELIHLSRLFFTARILYGQNLSLHIPASEADLDDIAFLYLLGRLRFLSIDRNPTGITGLISNRAPFDKP